MNKKLLSILLGIVIFAQLLFPTIAIIESNKGANSEQFSEIYKIRLMNIVYIKFSDRETYISCNIEDAEDLLDFDSFQKYAIITQNENGYANIEFTSKRPDCDNYISSKEYNSALELKGDKSFPAYENIFYAFFFDTDAEDPEAGREKIESNGHISVSKNLDIYLEASVYKGKLVRLGYYVDGERLEDLLEYYDENFQSLINE